MGSPLKYLVFYALILLLIEQFLLAEVITIGTIKVARGSDWLNRRMKAPLDSIGARAETRIQVRLHRFGSDIKSGGGVLDLSSVIRHEILSRQAQPLAASAERVATGVSSNQASVAAVCSVERVS